MKFKNTQRAIVIIGERESVQPHGVTRDFSDKEIENTPGIDAAIRKGYIVPFEGKEEPVAAPAPHKPVWDTEMSSGTPVTKKIAGGGTVEYVVADSDGADSVSMSDPDTVTSLPNNRSSDYIEEGVDARKFNHRSASEAFDAEIDAENIAADFDDEDTLSENESERDNILDVDEELARDATQVFTKNAGSKGGQQPKDVMAVVEESVSKSLGEVSKASKKSYDDAELQTGAPAKVVDFLKQNFPAKKWVISHETDASFLTEVARVTKSENVRSLAQQRLAELPKETPVAE